MGNKVCKGDPLSGGQKLFSEILDVIACDGRSDDEDDEVRMEADRNRDPRDRYPAVKSSYAGLAGSRSRDGSPQRRAHLAPQHQQQALPGESCVVTYDVMGESARMSPPGESMLVTSSQYAPASAYGLGGAGSPARATPLVETSTVLGGGLEPTKSFDIAAPYKSGDQIEIWSTSNQAWCVGNVEKGQGEFVKISYKSPTGQQITKVMPNGHEHLRYQGHPWTSNMNVSQGAIGLGLPSIATVVSPGTPMSLAEAPRSASPGLRDIPLSPPRQASSGPQLQSPSAAGTYKVGDEMEIFSASQQAWVRGKVSKSEGEWITISYIGADGRAMNKIMPNGHEHLRRGEASAFAGMEPANPKSSQPPEPPPPNYRPGDRIEIFSTSQNAWCAGEVSRLDGDHVHVNYRGPGGQPMNKIMPSGHAQLRILGA